jgi:hypothetical protein
LALFVIHRILRRGQVVEENQTDFSDALASAITSSHVYEEEIEIDSTSDG